MKVNVTVIKDSVIYDQKIYKKGESFDLDEKMAISLMEREYVYITGDEKVAEVLAENGVDTISIPFERAELELMEHKEIVQLAKDLGLKASGKKAEIIERILEFHAEEEFADDEAEDTEMPNTDMPE